MITRDGRLVRADVEVVEVSPPNGANTHAPYASGGRGAEGLFALFLVEVVRTPRHVLVGSSDESNQGIKGTASSGTERCGRPLNYVGPFRDQACPLKGTIHVLARVRPGQE